MTRADLIERAAFWQAGLMDIDHLRDVAYEAMDSEFDGHEFRLIAGDAKLDNDDARDLLARALRACGMDLPTKAEAERLVAVSVARSILAGEVEPIWGADLIGEYAQAPGSRGEEPSSEVWGPLVYDSCDCCNGLDEMMGAEKRRLRRKECREDIRRHLAHVLPRLVEWAGMPACGESDRPTGPGFLGWRRPLDSRRAEWRNLDRRIRWVLMRFWDPIGVGSIPEAKDEYADCVLHVRGLLVREASDADLAGPLAEGLLRWQEDRAGIPDTGVTARRRGDTVRELLHLRESW